MTNPETFPPLGAPIIDKSMLAGPSDPYEPPVRLPEEWIEGHELYPDEREFMYQLAEQQVKEYGYKEREHKAAIMIARSFSNQQIADGIGVSLGVAETVTQSLYDPSRHGVAHLIVRMGMQALVEYSQARLFPGNSTQLDQTQSILDRRTEIRLRAFSLSDREMEAARLSMQGHSHEMVGKSMHISTKAVGDHFMGIYRRTGLHDRIALIHMAYGTGQA